MITDPPKVFVYSKDVLIQSGLRAQLLESGQVTMEPCPGQAEVGVLAWPSLDEELSNRICQLKHSGCRKILLVIASIDADSLPAFFHCKASGVIRSGDVSPERLAQATLDVAAGGGYLPPDLIGHIVSSAHNPKIAWLGFSSTKHHLSKREEAVLTLLAEGYDTHQVAEELHYSERTIKGVVHQVIRRFGLRNRSHAVAYAIRNGLI